VSGPRPAHVTRRGAIYGVRFRVPTDLVQSLGIREFHRSLGTADPRVARQKAASVTIWFGETIEKLRQMPTPTQADLDAAAAAFFRKLIAEADVRRDFDKGHFDDDVALNVEQSRARIDELDDQFRANGFDGRVEHAARRIARKAGGTLDQLDPATKRYALELAANAEREQMRFVVQALVNPGKSFTPADYVPFQHEPNAPQPAKGGPQSGPRLGDAISAYLERKQRQRIGTSQMEEIARALSWLVDHAGTEARLADISPEDMRIFRDGVERFDVRMRGKSGTFLPGKQATRSSTSIPGRQRDTGHLSRHSSPGRMRSWPRDTTRRGV